VSQIFPRWTNRAPLAVGLGAPLLLGCIGLALWYWGSPRYTNVGYAPTQPVPYSHKLHAGDLGIDCRYCHNAVERAAFAALPPTRTCMNCHKIVSRDSVRLEPVRASFDSGKPLEWVKVHELPDYVFFDHSVHLAAGVGCVSCHGRVDQMRVVQIHAPLSMGWCLDCHRDPERHLRPRDQITSMTYDAKAAGYQASQDASRPRKVNPPVHCSGCHR
jgi:hypothetical protein